VHFPIIHPKTLIHIDPSNKIERWLMPEKEEKEKDLLKELCGNDTKLYAFLCHTLYVDPIAAISKRDLAILIEEAEKSFKDENYGDAFRKYQPVMYKAIFETTQNPGEKDRYIKVIQDLASKTAKVTEKVKEKAEKEGLVARARYLEEEIKNYEFLSERIEDVIKTASLFYNERLEELGAKERQEVRREKRIATERDEEREKRDEMERQAARRKERKGMGKEERKEAETEEKRIELGEKEKGEARRKEREEAETEEKRIEEREKERREVGRKERRALEFTALSCQG
jgi:hypothetical protein